jgi:hypothetical protein
LSLCREFRPPVSTTGRKPLYGAAVRYGALAGALGVVLFAIGGLLVGERPPLDADAVDLSAYMAANGTRIEVACALFGAAAALFAWFLASVASIAPRREAGLAALACGLVFLALFLADCTALAVAALRPHGVVVALRDFELLAMGVASFAAAGMLLALAATGVWPRRLSRLAVVAALLYTLRVGTLFTITGPFAADGLLGLRVPVIAIASWWLAASLFLLVSPRWSTAQQSPSAS